MVSRAFIVNVTEGSLNWVRLWAIARQPQEAKARMLFQPSVDSLRLVNPVIVQDQEDALDLRPADLFQRLKQLSKERIVLLLSDDVMNPARPVVERSGQISTWVKILRDYELERLRGPVVARILYPSKLLPRCLLLLILARRRDLDLCALDHPLIADLRQEVKVEFITPEEDVGGP